MPSPGTRTSAAKNPHPPLPPDPFGALRLRGNPFRELSDDELELSWLGSEMMLEASGWSIDAAPVVEFVGERGWGKTTRLMILRSQLRRAGRSTSWQYVEPHKPQVEIPAAARAWFVDEADRLPRRRLRALLRGAVAAGARLFAGTHRSLASDAAAVGARCRTVQLRAPAEANVCTLYAERIALHAFAGGPRGRLHATEAAALLRVAGPNLHTILGILYELFQGYAERGRIPSRIEEAEIADAAARVARQTTELPPRA